MENGRILGRSLWGRIHEKNVVPVFFGGNCNEGGSRFREKTAPSTPNGGAEPSKRGKKGTRTKAERRLFDTKKGRRTRTRASIKKGRVYVAR